MISGELCWKQGRQTRGVALEDINYLWGKLMRTVLAVSSDQVVRDVMAALY